MVYCVPAIVEFVTETDRVKSTPMIPVNSFLCGKKRIIFEPIYVKVGVCVDLHGRYGTVSIKAREKWTPEI